MKWEYRIIQIDTGTSFLSRMLGETNALGKCGWELVTPLTNYMTNQLPFLIFKRKTSWLRRLLSKGTQ